MPSNDTLADAIEVGRRMAEQTLRRLEETQRTRMEALKTNPSRLEVTVSVTSKGRRTKPIKWETSGFLIALGDSWFDYPFHDVLKVLHDRYGYDIESAAHHGDRIEAMAYHGGQLDLFARCLQKGTSQGMEPKAVLLSGGGNDIAGEEFGMLLNSNVSPIRGWNDEIVDGVLGKRIATAYYSLITSINDICECQLKHKLPIIMHGYDYPVPDGRGVFGGWLFPGPWLKPGFREKGFADLPCNVAFMHNLIDRFNSVLMNVAQDQKVRYVNLRGTLSTDPNTYRHWWDNELHPTKDGFEAIAAKFVSELRNLEQHAAGVHPKVSGGRKPSRTRARK